MEAMNDKPISMCCRVWMTTIVTQVAKDSAFEG